VNEDVGEVTKACAVAASNSTKPGSCYSPSSTLSWGGEGGILLVDVDNDVVLSLRPSTKLPLTSSSSSCEAALIK